MPKQPPTTSSTGSEAEKQEAVPAREVAETDKDEVLGVAASAGNAARAAQVPPPSGPPSTLSKFAKSAKGTYAEPSLPHGVRVRAGKTLLNPSDRSPVGVLKHDAFLRLVSEAGGHRTIQFNSGPKLVGNASAAKGNYLVSSDDSAKPTYEAVNTPVFAEEPSVDHVKQGKVGDCYLLAALISIVNQRPGFIKEMVKDNGDTVTVRLYRGHKSEHVTIAKSVVRLDGEDYFAKNSLWVQMIEKAYAAAGFGGKAKNDVAARKGDQTGHRFGRIQLGVADHAFQVLTGVKVENSRTSISKKVSDDDPGGALGSGTYSQVQSDLFDEIHSGLEDGELLTLSTKSSLGPATSEGVNGEGVVDGMLGGHAYGVLDTRTDPSALKWIQIKDTYATYVRERAEGAQQPPSAAKDGVFWIELSELTREFSTIRKGALPAAPAAFDKHKHKLEKGSQVIDLHDHPDAYAHYSYDLVKDGNGRDNKKANDHLTVENSLATLLATEKLDTHGVSDWRAKRSGKTKREHNDRLEQHQLTGIDNLHFRPKESKQGTSRLNTALDPDGNLRKAPGGKPKNAAPESVAVDDKLSLGSFATWLKKVFDATGVDIEISTRILASMDAVRARMGVSAEELYLTKSQRGEFAKFALLAVGLSGLTKGAGGITVPPELKGLPAATSWIQITSSSFDDSAYKAGLSPELYEEIRAAIAKDEKWTKKEGESGFAPVQSFLLDRHWDTIRGWVVTPA